MTHDTSMEPGRPGRDAVAHALADIARPGSFFDGAERLAIAQRARVAMGLAEDAPYLPPAHADAVDRVAASAHTIRRTTVDMWHKLGLDRTAYVELVSVVVRTVAVDRYFTALGTSVAALPTPTAGEATPNVDEAAEITTGWVPTVGPAGAVSALSAVPDELESMFELHTELYLSPRLVMAVDKEPGRELTRPQMELVAARTSWLNDCFY